MDIQDEMIRPWTAPAGHALLELATTLAWNAAAAIMQARPRGVFELRKADGSPVSTADYAAQSVILAGLRRSRPDIPVICEESAEPGLAQHAADGRCWMVDPLDGTREFCAGLDEFTVNVGLVHAGRTRLGAVAVPATGELFAGIVGVGAWKEDATGRRRRITVRRPPAEGAVVLVSRSHGDEARLASFLAGRRVKQVVRSGSSLKLCRIAEGAADLYPRFGPTMEWDTAAAQAVLEAAGGAVRTLDGAALRYAKPGLRNPEFICTGADLGTSCGRLPC